MLLPELLFLSFILWTLLHWQALPELLRDESADDAWPLTMDHVATPIRLWLVAGGYALLSYLVFSGLCRFLVVLDKASVLDGHAAWLALILLICAHFLPYSASGFTRARYFFQRHLFFPALPSHQEYKMIRQLLLLHEREGSIADELRHVYTLLKKEVNSPVHALRTAVLKSEWQLVSAQYKNIKCEEIPGIKSSVQEQQLRLQLYCCYRLLVRLTLARYWSGKSRRREFRRLSYCINSGDHAIYGSTRRMKFWMWNNINLHLIKRRKVNRSKKMAPQDITSHSIKMQQTGEPSAVVVAREVVARN